MKNKNWRSGRGTRGTAMILFFGTLLLLTIPAIGATVGLASNAPRSTTGPVPPTTHSVCKAAAGTNPLFDAYDPVNHEVYVPNLNSASLTILNGTCKLVAKVTLPTGAYPAAAGFDPENNHVYVTDAALSQVYVFSGTRLVNTITSSTFNSPWGVAFDPAISNMAVANYGSDTVTFIFGTSVSFTTTVGSGPYLFAYDLTFGRLLVTNFASANVTSMSGLFPFLQTDNINIPVGTQPAGIAFDLANDYDYVANYGSNNVTIIDSTGGHYGSVTVGSHPFGVVWDQAKLSVYVANSGSNTVSVISGSSVARTIYGPSGSGLHGIAYDEATDQVFVSGYTNKEVYVYN